MKKYQVIYADPPWKYGSKQYQDNSRDFDKLENHYSTMRIEDIKNLAVKEITSESCACFLWVTDSHLKEGLDVLNSWGFKYKTVAFVWVKKTNKGNTCVNFAPWTLKSCELCLLGIKGTMGKYKSSNNIRQLVEAIRSKHSKKPKDVMTRIEMLFETTNKLELFAREKCEGWDSWGNEVHSDVNF